MNEFPDRIDPLTSEEGIRLHILHRKQLGGHPLSRKEEDDFRELLQRSRALERQKYANSPEMLQILETSFAWGDAISSGMLAHRKKLLASLSDLCFEISFAVNKLPDFNEEEHTHNFAMLDGFSPFNEIHVDEDENHIALLTMHPCIAAVLEICEDTAAELEKIAAGIRDLRKVMTELGYSWEEIDDNRMKFSRDIACENIVEEIHFLRIKFATYNGPYL